jgi:hypothetical protein
MSGYYYHELNRIAVAYESFLEQNAAWMKQQVQWRAEDLAMRKNWEEQEQARFEHRMEVDHKVLIEFHARLESIYREEVRKHLELRELNELLKKREGHE